MKILRVFNNNVVLARGGDGGEVVLTGRGLGFQKKPGQDVDPSRVARTFAPTDGRDADHTGQLLAAIPTEFLEIAEQAMLAVGLGREENPATLVALADHLSFAATRVREGIVIDHPLQGEVEHLYPEEYAAAGAILAHVNERIDVTLPPEEAVPIAMHLVNASFATGDLSQTYAMTDILQQLFEVIEQTYGRTFDTHTVNAARFITHLRYFFVRVKSGRQLEEGHAAMLATFTGAYPEAARCAARLATVLELRLGERVTADEVAYLTMHVARLTGD
ncbi:PRD domain-containing protein [Mobilicoccus caccae]|uniref:Transcription antiterminator BglG n=1 Tax=Mobilicoccus caccae TaxID=1859295 RepID=A0ABQ6IXV1_9MICO|nr:PRD domain-containing protein [Mobilicoccus caccae]GMA41508.1 transcription antiterminator BglG [Mobilicoccus caccae]